MSIKTRLFQSAFLVLFLSTAGVWFSSAEARNIERVSISTLGAELNNYSFEGSMSGDGRFVVFSSGADNAVLSDTNGKQDVFVRDQMMNKTILVSVASDGTQGDQDSLLGPKSIDSSGRYVVFETFASNLAIGVSEMTGFRKVVWHDIQTGETRIISEPPDFPLTFANQGSFEPHISADGKYVIFYSAASNLVPGDTNGAADAFLYNVAMKSLTLVSVNSLGVQGNGDTQAPDISSDGRYITFYSDASNLVTNDLNSNTDVFVRDSKTGTTTRVSVSSTGTEGNDYSYLSFISDDGSKIVFTSAASNLVAGDTNGKPDVYLHDMGSGTTKRVSIAPDGTEPNGQSYANGASSADGRYVVFGSDSSNLSLIDSSGQRNIYVRDMQTGLIQLFSSPDTSSAADSMNGRGFLSPDAKWICLESYATNLIASDTNSNTDVFLIEFNWAPTAKFLIEDAAHTDTWIPNGRTFDAHTSSDQDGSIISYDWDFGDGTTATGVRPTHVYSAPSGTTFIITLTVTDNAGNTGQSQQSMLFHSILIPKPTFP